MLNKQIKLNFVSLIHDNMRKNILIFTLLLQVFFSITSSAQIVYAENKSVENSLKSGDTNSSVPMLSKNEVIKFTFENYNKTLSDDVDIVDKSLLKQRFQAIQQTYTYTTPVAPGNPGLKTLIHKPAIYNSVMKLEKYYKKQLKNGMLSEEVINRALLKAYDVALVAFYNNTDEFEKQLKSTKQITSISNIFERAEINHK